LVYPPQKYHNFHSDATIEIDSAQDHVFQLRSNRKRKQGAGALPLHSYVCFYANKKPRSGNAEAG
jgi:hypothetical protein